MIKRSVFGLLLFSLTGCEKMADAQMNGIYDKVSRDAVAQYEIAERQGDPIQMCVQAGLVAASYLQAKDETNYEMWKSTEKSVCARAGIRH